MCKKQMQSPRPKYNMKQIEKYEDLELASLELLRGIYEYGFTKLPDLHKKCIMPIISSEPPIDVVVNAYCGTSKTAAYAISILNRIYPIDDSTYSKGCPQALILVSTRELAKSVSYLIKSIGRGLNVSAFPLIGGTKTTEMIENLNEIHHVIVGTPGTTWNAIVRGYLNVKYLKILIIDEFEYILDGGFKDCVEEILNSVRKINLQICLFSQDFKEERVMNFIEKELRNPVKIV
ncbi:predicted protein [Naegleria gruberi]|uniref:ATP-dependent RNA helicase n=1 Tax=Naegleria gruberi TaxID=5762 RepID=D2VT65_NAEGR|nr:uncharacterized protein NAEGRDRAFT_72190 [Naegleria gruberi]EFC40029.1 predicted protein [Naegleria gruberi]|eukprot:XP_002672773.1 predicted protein [Naegleria gruberi strain NEG-M]